MARAHALLAALAVLCLAVGAGRATAKPKPRHKPPVKHHVQPKPKPQPQPTPPPAPAPPPNPNPSFSVDVVSTITRHHVEHQVAPAAANGCAFHTDSDATQTVTTSLKRPVVVTYRSLLAGAQPLSLLSAEVQQDGSYTYGYQDGCPYLATTPRYASDTSSCGTGAVTVVTDATALGFLPGTNEFEFAYSYGSTDPFDGGCVHDVFATNAIGDADALTVSIPPTPTWPATTTVDPAKLLAAKDPVVIRYDRTETLGTPGVLADTYTVSWTVTLTPRG